MRIRRVDIIPETPTPELIRAMEDLDHFLYTQMQKHAERFTKTPTSQNLEDFILIMKADEKVDCFLEKWSKPHAVTPVR